MKTTTTKKNKKKTHWSPCCTYHTIEHQVGIVPRPLPPPTFPSAKESTENFTCCSIISAVRDMLMGSRGQVFSFSQVNCRQTAELCGIVIDAIRGDTVSTKCSYSPLKLYCAVRISLIAAIHTLHTYFP